MSILADLLTGVGEFMADIFVLRRQRDARGHPRRSIGDDASAIARFDFVTMLFISLMSVGLMFLLVFVFGVPVVWAVGGGTVVGAAWGYWRYLRLVREE